MLSKHVLLYWERMQQRESFAKANIVYKYEKSSLAKLISEHRNGLYTKMAFRAAFVVAAGAAGVFAYKHYKKLT
jgi:hypothetical protein